MAYDPLAPAVQDNPYQYYEELRDKAQIAWVESMQSWAVSRYTDVGFILRTPALFSSTLWNEAASGDLVTVPEAPGLLSMDPPDHRPSPCNLRNCVEPEHERETELNRIVMLNRRSRI